MSPANSPDSLRDEPLRLPSTTPPERWSVRLLAWACLALAPLLRRRFPHRWEQLSSFHLHNLVSVAEESLTLRYLKHGADPNGRSTASHSGTTPLESAALSGSVRVLEVLLLAGAEVNGGDHHGRTALMVAAEFGHTDAVAFLLDSGARVNDVESAFGYTALFLAAQSGHLAVVKLLVARGADIAHRARHRRSAADWARFLGGKPRDECAIYLDDLSEPA